VFDLPSKSNIEKISYDLLKHSKSLDVFPTPVNQIVEYAELRVAKGVDLSSPQASFLSRLPSHLHEGFTQAIQMVRGFIDRGDKTIYLDLTQKQPRQNFVKLHEVGHDVLKWQKEILDHLDNDDTLAFEAKEEFEAEANYFASLTLFQHDRFEHEMKKLELGIKSPMALAKKFGGSNHAAFRRYVEHSKKRCALLVLENCTSSGLQAFCFKKDFFVSTSFEKTFGSIELPDKFGFKWTFTQDYYFKKKFHEKGSLTLTTANGEADFVYHFFYNTYNAFVFLFPVGEENKTSTKIVITKS
jgi:hypothetical protein